jgi:hypothetical protein
MPRHDRATETAIQHAEDEIAAALGILVRLINAARLTTDEDVLEQLREATQIAAASRDRWRRRREALDVWQD